MTWPQGGDFVRDVNSPLRLLQADRRICRHDNGTDLCDAGHKLRFPGTCLSQEMGTFNSTDASFQPTYPVCTVDYNSSGFSPHVLFATGETLGNFVAATTSPPSLLMDFWFATSDVVADDTFWVRMAPTVVEGATWLDGIAAQRTSSVFLATTLATASAFWKTAQFNPGVLPHWPGVTSELFAYDVFCGFPVYKRLVSHVLTHTGASLRQVGSVDSFGNLVQTDRYTTITDDQNLCVGDFVPPYITLHSPTVSGAHVRPRDQIIDFSLSDPVGGVDLSTVYVTAFSTASGTIPLLEAGADQTGGRVSVVGDSSSYRITYTPPFLWAYNDRVLVTITGSDAPPLVGGDPFFCGGGGVNEFVGDIPFQVLNLEDFSATISGVGDTDPPYLTELSPGSGTSGNNVAAPVVLSIADSITGVDLSSLEVVVNGVLVVTAGAALTSSTWVAGTPAKYTVAHYSPTAFTYGDTIEVSVYAKDRVYAAPNILDTSYEFSCISDSTLIVENFLPPVGTSKNPELLDISVDIRDDTYGVTADSCHLVIDGATISGTQSPLASGIQIVYHPENDFISAQPIRVVVHAVNGNTAAPVVRDVLYTLYPGYRVAQFNTAPFEHDSAVEVFVRARNMAVFPRDLSEGYFFTTYSQPSVSLGAEIVADNPTSNISAQLNVIAPEHRYGQTVTVTFYLKDLDGHELGPYTFTYTIEDSPGT